MKPDKIVIYNGACPICSREVNAYRRMAEDSGASLRFADLNDTDLDTLGLTPETAARRLHVIENGRLVSGVDAFSALWHEIPRLGWLARIVSLALVRPVAHLAYERIAAPALYALHRRRERRRARVAG